jgi:hypothetical protein
MVVQLEAGERESIDPPDFGAGLAMLETHNNLMWLSSIINVPILLNMSAPLQTTPAVRAPAPSPSTAAVHVATPAGGGPNVVAAGCHDKGPPIRNPSQYYL